MGRSISKGPYVAYHLLKKIIITFFLLTFSLSSLANQSVEEIIKGRKAMFSENYQNAKRISVLLKSKKLRKQNL